MNKNNNNEEVVGSFIGDNNEGLAEEWVFYDLLEYFEERLNINASELLKDFNEWLEKQNEKSNN